MIIGTNEHLETALEQYRENQNESTILSVMNKITICLAAGEEWFVPIDLIGDGPSEKISASGGRPCAALSG